MATDRPDEPCWCTTASISPAALARIPESARNRVCICAECAEGREPGPAAAGG